VTKSESVAAMWRAAREAEAGLYGESEEVAAYQRYIAAQLERRLRQSEAEADIPTCADFTHVGVECCPDELELIEIESGGRAWICCSIDRALNPSKHMALEQTSVWSTPTA
jgi:hypothetical protein